MPILLDRGYVAGNSFPPFYVPSQPTNHLTKVIVSYLVQLSLSISFFLLAKILVFGIPVIQQLLNRNKGESSISRLSQRPVRSRPYKALFSTLVEFQEVQGLFVLSIQAATLTRFAASGACGYPWTCPAIDSVSSFGEAFLNAQFARGLAINSALSVLLTQATLQRAGLRWSYLLVLTGSVCALAAGIYWQGDGGQGELGFGSSFDMLWDSLRATHPIDRCGGNPNLQAYCVATLSRPNHMFLGIWGFVATCTMTLWLMADMVLGSEAARKWWRESGDGRVRRFLGGSDHAVRVMADIAFELGWIGLQVVLTALVLVYLAEVAEIAFGVGLDSSQWNYGQFIAATVWAPILVKYLYYNICEFNPKCVFCEDSLTMVDGVEQGFSKRLVHQYEIIRRKSDLVGGRGIAQMHGTRKVVDSAAESTRKGVDSRGKAILVN